MVGNKIILRLVLLNSGILNAKFDILSETILGYNLIFCYIIYFLQQAYRHTLVNKQIREVREMYDIFIKPLDFSENRFIFFGCFYDLNRIEEILDYLINSPMDGDMVYRLSLKQKYPNRFYDVLIKDSITDERMLIGVYDTENNKFTEEEKL